MFVSREGGLRRDLDPVVPLQGGVYTWTHTRDTAGLSAWGLVRLVSRLSDNLAMNQII